MSLAASDRMRACSENSRILSYVSFGSTPIRRDSIVNVRLNSAVADVYRASSLAFSSHETPGSRPRAGPIPRMVSPQLWQEWRNLRTPLQLQNGLAGEWHHAEP